MGRPVSGSVREFEQGIMELDRAEYMVGGTGMVVISND